MKFVMIVGSGAVGKMTVGQELMKITGLRLFHNHMMIEPVLEIFGGFNGRAVSRLREVIFEEYAQSDLEGLIFTFMWAFDMQEDWDYVHHLTELFKSHGSEIYCVELVADQNVRLERNATENRRANKASKRDEAVSRQRILHEDASYRLVSHEGEIPFENYMKIDNTYLSAEEAAAMIKEKFNL